MSKKDLKTSSLGYSGKATIQIRKGNKVIKTLGKHNSGFPALFARIASVLTSGVNRTQEARGMPQYLDVGTVDSNGFKSLLGSRVAIEGAYVQSTGAEYVALFSVVIPGVRLTDLTKSITAFRLCSELSTADINYLAGIDLNEEDYITVSSQDYSILVKWEMRLINVNSEVN